MKLGGDLLAHEKEFKLEDKGSRAHSFDEFFLITLCYYFFKIIIDLLDHCFIQCLVLYLWVLLRYQGFLQEVKCS